MYDKEGWKVMNNLGNKAIMAANIKKYLEITGKTQKDVCKELGFKESTFSDWLNAKVYPRIDKIEILANYFGIKKADLVEDHTTNQNIELTHHEKDFIKKYRVLDERGKSTVDRTLESEYEYIVNKSKATQNTAG